MPAKMVLNTDLFKLHAANLIINYKTAVTPNEKKKAMNCAFKAAMALGNGLTEGINFHSCTQP